MKEFSDHNDLLGVFQGKKEILTSVMYLPSLGSHHGGTSAQELPWKLEWKNICQADSMPEVEKGTAWVSQKIATIT